MARTIPDIYDALNASKASMSELNDFVVSTSVPGSTQDYSADLAVDVSSGSKVAIWRLWLWIFSVGSWMVETLFDRHTSDITEVLDAKRVHTLRWYADQAKQWQYGYALSWINNQYQYAVSDDNAKIIKYAAASENNGKVTLKVAKDSGGTKVPLATLEKSTFTDYMKKAKDAGVVMEIVSLPADQLKVHITIVRDRLVLDANNNLLRNNAINPIAQAIEAFGQSLEFDGILRLSKLVDAIQAAEGVIDVMLDQAWWKPAGGTYTPVAMSVEAAAGYFEVNYTDSSFIYQDNVEVTILS